MKSALLILTPLVLTDKTIYSLMHLHPPDAQELAGSIRALTATVATLSQEVAVLSRSQEMASQRPN